MKMYFKKYELSGVVPLKFLGLYELQAKQLDEKKSATQTSQPSFPIYEYPKISQTMSKTNDDRYYLGLSFNHTVEIKNLEDYPTLFLEFADLDFRNQSDLYNFIMKYGFLFNAPQSIKATFHQAIGMPPAGYTKTSSREIKKQLLLKRSSLSSSASAPVVHESLEMWIRLQACLRTLIKVWRYLKNVKLKRNSPETGKPYYENELFEFENGVLTFADILSYAYVTNLKDPIENFYKEDRYLNESLFQSLKIDSLNSYINLTEDFKNHNSENKQNESIPTYFLQHFAEEFLKAQINGWMEKFSPIFNRKGNLSSNNDSTSDNFKNGTRMICNSLSEAIIYQFLETLTNDKEFIRCLECQKWMNTGRKKSERKNYCSNQCRAKAYERRKKLSDTKEVLNIITSSKSIVDIIPKIKKLKENKTDESIFDIFSDIFAPNLNDTDKILFNNILKNCFDNFSVETQQSSICNHLGINVDQSETLMDHIHFTTSGLMRFNYSPYWDWDADYS